MIISNQGAKVFISKMTFNLEQEGNTLGTTSNYEDLKIEVECPTGDISEDIFYVLKTNSGWSFDSIEELKEIFNQIVEMVESWQEIK